MPLTFRQPRPAHFVIIFIVAIILLSAALSWFTVKRHAAGAVLINDENVIATIGDQPIYLKDFQKAYKNYQSRAGSTSGEQSNNAQSPQLKTKFFKSYLEKKILLLEADGRGIKISPEELDAKVKKIQSSYGRTVFLSAFDEEGLNIEDWKAQLKEEMAIERLFSQIGDVSNQVTDDNMRNYYETNPELFASAEAALRVCHWLASDKDEAASLAQELKAKLAAEPAATVGTICNPDSGVAGKYLTKNDLEAKIWSALYPMATGEISMPIKSEFGYHIFLLLEKRRQGVLSYIQAKAEIKSAMENDLKEKAYIELVKELKKKWPIKVNETVLASVN